MEKSYRQEYFYNKASSQGNRTLLFLVNTFYWYCGHREKDEVKMQSFTIIEPNMLFVIHAVKMP